MALLASLFEGWPKFDLGEGAFYAVFGFLFVFLGIALLILIFSLLGMLMKKINARPGSPRRPKEKRETQEKTKETAQAALPPDRLSPELVAVISAAIAAYYEENAAKCEFVVRRIKRL